MHDVGGLLAYWGYLAIFFVVILGNIGLPIPEETVLVLAGYLVWEGTLSLHLVLAVGVASAVVGDNIGYWLGRELGRRVLERYGHWLWITPERLDATQRYVLRFGAWGVFLARFVPGLRFLAGPVAGATGLPPWAFLVANICGAMLYVPIAVAIGYAIGLGFGDYIAKLEGLAGAIERLVLWSAGIAAAVALVWHILRDLRSPRT
jgi:membrane protein DedA with SNARE-associated domain